MYFPDETGIHAVLTEAKQHVFPDAGGIHEGEKDRVQPHVAQVFGNIPGNAAVDIPDLSCIPASGNIGAGRISLDIHKDRADYNNVHGLLLISFRCPVWLSAETLAFFPSYHRRRMKNNRKTTRSKTV
jgi:hypothetical protein